MQNAFSADHVIIFNNYHQSIRFCDTIIKKLINHASTIVCILLIAPSEGMRMQESKLEMMIQGHEIWLEKIDEQNGEFSLALAYGHNMRQDGLADAKRLNAFVYLPDGKRESIDLIPDKNRYLIRVKPEKDSYRTVIVDMGSIVFTQTKKGYEQGPKSQFKDVIYAGAFHQMAKFICSAGDDKAFSGKVEHGILEIVPKTPNCKVGQDAELQVFYEGKPLPEAEIKAVSKNLERNDEGNEKKSEGKEMAFAKTDGNGIARIPVTEGGQWMFLARHRDPTKKVNDAFDESVFVNTLVMECR